MMRMATPKHAPNPSKTAPRLRPVRRFKMRATTRDIASRLVDANGFVRAIRQNRKTEQNDGADSDSDDKTILRPSHLLGMVVSLRVIRMLGVVIPAGTHAVGRIC